MSKRRTRRSHGGPRASKDVAGAGDIAAVVTSAFPRLPPPEAASLVPRSSFNDPERAAFARSLAGTAWWELAPATSVGFADAPALLEPAAFRYYLPGLLLALIRDFSRLDVAADNILTALTLPSHEDLGLPDDLMNLMEGPLAAAVRDAGVGVESHLERATFIERFGPLSLRQKHAVRATLEWLARILPPPDAERIAEVLNSYWRRETSGQSE